MSKSKGNVVDPLELVDSYGADALRFTMAAMAAQGRDVNMSIPRVEGYRNFATKLWNAARFAEMNGCIGTYETDPGEIQATLNQWIVSELASTAASVTSAIEAYRFNEAADALYHFIWHTYCDWYVELSKPVFSSGDEVLIEESRAVTAFVLDEMLKLLHPFMPFMTEELWDHFGQSGRTRETMLIKASWPEYQGLEDEPATSEINWLIGLISEVRSARAEMNVQPSAEVPLVLCQANEVSKARLSAHETTLKRMARLSDVSLAETVPSGAVQLVIGEAVAALCLRDVIDVSAESARLGKEMGKVQGEIKKLSGKLSNEQFLAKAPDDVVAEQQRRLDEEKGRLEKLEAALTRLKAVS